MHPSGVLVLFIPLCVLSPLPALATQTRPGRPIFKEPHAVTAGSQSRLSRHAASQWFRHLRRAEPASCPASFDQCGNGLPDNFCCPSDSSCLSVADDTTVICCPDGEDCSSIEAASFTCDIAAYNATAFPTAIVHTTNLTGQLPTCGSHCCPFGYSCSGDSLCTRDKDDTLVTATSASSATTAGTTASATGTGLSVPSTSAAVATSSPEPDNSASPSINKTRTIGIATGSAVAGLVGLVAIILFVWVRRRSRAAEPASDLLRSTRGKTEPASPVLDQPGLPPPQYPNTPPPLPRKNSVRPPKTKRKSMLSWVPSIVNRTPAELPATPVSFRHWGQLERPNEVYRPYPRDSLREDEIYELEARWLPR